MIVQAVGALFNACWQGLAIAGVISLALRFLPRSSAATRYAIWFAALLVVAALPGIDFGLASMSRPQPIIDAASSRFSVVSTGTVTYNAAHPRTSGSALVGNIPTTTIGYAVEVPPDRVSQLRVLAAGAAARIGSLLSSVAVPIAIVWLFFSVLLLCRLALAYIRLRNVKLGLIPLDDARVDRLIAGSSRPVVVGVADDLAMPCVLGFARPAIALPARLAVELDRDDLERIVRHEHAHVRRWDDIANALQLIVQAVMCLNPAVHAIGRSLDVEREIACDDFAVEPLAERVQYAKCLTHIAVSGFGRGRALPAPGFFFNRKQLLVRVERLLERGHNGSTTIATAARYALAGIGVVAIAVARVQLPVFAATTHLDVKPATKTSQHAAAPVNDYLSHAHAFVASLHVAGSHNATNHAALDRHGHIHNSMIHVAYQMPDLKLAHMKLQAARPLSLASKVLAKLPPTRLAAMASSVTRSPVAPAPHVTAHAPLAVAMPGAGSTGSKDFLDALAAAGYKNVSVNDLIQLKNVGVDGTLIEAAVRYAGERPSVETLVHLASVGVDADFLRRLQSSGYPRMPLEDVVRIRAIGVDPTYIRDMTAALRSRLSIEQLTQLRALGVDSGFVRGFAQLGYDRLTPNELMSLRAIGVDADYVRMLRSKGIGGSRLSVEDLIRMKSAGVE